MSLCIIFDYSCFLKGWQSTWNFATYRSFGLHQISVNIAHYMYSTVPLCVYELYGHVRLTPSFISMSLVCVQWVCLWDITQNWTSRCDIHADPSILSFHHYGLLSHLSRCQNSNYQTLWTGPSGTRQYSAQLWLFFEHFLSCFETLVRDWWRDQTKHKTLWSDSHIGSWWPTIFTVSCLW
jgi:hypothetical protein